MAVPVVADRAKVVRERADPVKDARHVKAAPKVEDDPVKEIVRVREADLARAVPAKVGHETAVPVVVLPVRVAPVEADREAATSISIRWSA